MNITELFNQNELTIMTQAIQNFKNLQESEEDNREEEGWDTQYQHQLIETLEIIEEKLFDFIE